jgi:ribosomal protein S18 acetylase RimI-like enzyme
LQLYANDPDTCFVAVKNDRIVGFVLGTVIEKARSAWRYGYVAWLGVDKKLATKGVGTRLLDRLTEVFVYDGVRMLILDTEATNEDAIRFFERRGFGNPHHHVYLEKNLEVDEDWKGDVKAARAERKMRERYFGGKRQKLLAPPVPARRPVRT